MVKKIKTKIDVPKNDCTLLSFKTFFTHIKKNNKKNNYIFLIKKTLMVKYFVLECYLKDIILFVKI